MSSVADLQRVQGLLRSLEEVDFEYKEKVLESLREANKRLLQITQLQKGCFSFFVKTRALFEKGQSSLANTAAHRREIAAMREIGFQAIDNIKLFNLSGGVEKLTDLHLNAFKLDLQCTIKKLHFIKKLKEIVLKNPELHLLDLILLINKKDLAVRAFFKDRLLTFEEARKARRPNLEDYAFRVIKHFSMLQPF